MARRGVAPSREADQLMHAELEAAAAALSPDGNLATLREAAANSIERITFARGWLRAKIDERDRHSDVVAFGSLARHEFTAASDFDYLVLSYELDPDPRGPRKLLATADALRREIAIARGANPPDEVRGPGATKLFGVVMSAVDLSEHIGLEDDTNHNQTRRLLLLEESVSLLDPAKHSTLIETILARYLIGYEDGIKPGVPRFLLNDVIRYWRTIAVDYQAKVWRDAEDGWGLRYLKLIISRKIAYAGTLATLMLCSEEQPASADSLARQFAMPPLARLAQLHRHLKDDPKALEALRSVLEIADHFAERSGDKMWRGRVKLVTDLGHAHEVPEFVEMRNKAVALQDALQAIFFDTVLLGKTSRKYLAF